MADIPHAGAAFAGSVRATHDQLHDLLPRPEAADASQYGALAE